jgi:hypothetical protein
MTPSPPVFVIWRIKKSKVCRLLNLVLNAIEYEIGKGKSIYFIRESEEGGGREGKGKGKWKVESGKWKVESGK